MISYKDETIITDSVEALILSITECFPETQRIGCFYHYINDINRKLNCTSFLQIIIIKIF